MSTALKILVPVKRVLDYAVRPLLFLQAPHEILLANPPS